MKPTINSTKYGFFRGIDLQGEGTAIDNSRSPMAINLIPDSDGFPEKRRGFRKIFEVKQVEEQAKDNSKRVNGIFRTILKDNVACYIFHIGTELYRWNGVETEAPTLLKSGIANHKSKGFTIKNAFYILTGSEYLQYNGEKVQDVCEIAKIPLHIIARAPSGGGKVYENVNLLQSKRKIGFLADGTSKDYILPSQKITSVDEVNVDDVVLDSSKYTVDLEKGKVTFTESAPAKPKTDGKDNVHITYSYSPEGYKERIINCTLQTLYGRGNNDRVVLSGNPKYKNYDWTSGYNDPTYFPDTGYAVVGNETTAIMGYGRIGDNLVIVKESNSNDSTIFFRSVALQGDETVFITKQSIVGIGMVAPDSMSSIDDESMFLSERGVYSIVSNALTTEKTVQNRSYFINSALNNEPNLDKAMVASFQNRYMIFVNNKVYLLDGNQDKTFKEEFTGSYVYECFLWDNIPATAVCTDNNVFLYGNNDGQIFRYNDDKKIDTEIYNDDGKVIKAVWTTKVDDDGDFSRYKTMLKQGFAFRIKPFSRSGLKVYLQKDGMEDKLTYESAMDIFDWLTIDFTRFTFRTSSAPTTVAIKAKVKNYITLQIKVINDGENEGFGLLGITKLFVYGKLIKGVTMHH